jgi:hypothetical protein
MSISRRIFLAMTAATFVARPFLSGTKTMPKIPPNLDHILLGVSDLQRGIDWVEERSGVRATFGGVHPGRGTQNALLSLGTRRYLEIIAPDPTQSISGDSMASELRKLKEPTVVAWAVHTNDLATLVKKARAAGIDMEDIRDGSRARPDGKLLRWKACGLRHDFDGLLPFFIEWSSDSIHPSVDPHGCILDSFSLESSSREVGGQAVKLELGVESREAKKSSLQARIQGKHSSFELS